MGSVIVNHVPKLQYMTARRPTVHSPIECWWGSVKMFKLFSPCPPPLTSPSRPLLRRRRGVAKMPFLEGEYGAKALSAAGTLP